MALMVKEMIYYNYSATGERNFKFTMPRLDIQQNAWNYTPTIILDQPTLYASPLVTLTAKGYTKHYFEEGRRICSKIGGGMHGNVTEEDILDHPVPALDNDYDGQFSHQQEGVYRTFMECVGAEPQIIEDNSLSAMLVEQELGRNEPEPAYFYHGDHLGSAAYLTSQGAVVQTLTYLPYGEDWVDVQNNLDPNLGIYRFNGKEKDWESGFHYYGARYYWSELLTGWLSVDPMMDKYPGISPYAYCMWNPVKLVDPDGRDVWKLDNLGNIVEHTECNDYDCVHIVDGKGKIISSSNYYEFGTISELCLDGQSNTSFSICGFENAKELFESLAGQYTKENNMPIEWAHATVAAKDSYGLGMDNTTNILTTTHEKASVDLGIWIDNGYVVSRQAHNHPSGTKRPSDIIERNGRRHGDVPTALTFEKIFPSIENYIYIPSWGYSRYDSNGSLDSRVLNPKSLPGANINGGSAL